MVSYKKLWILLIKKNMKKTDLRLQAGISTTALAKLGKNKHVNTEVLTKICKTLDCNIEDIVEVLED
jgi:DNA-binding Xre family transcriptional regulator